MHKTKDWRSWPAERRFHFSYTRTPGLIAGSDCWEWDGYLSDEGYALLMMNGRRWLARRLALEVIAGDGPLGRRRVYTTCGNPSCVNPAHLTTGVAPETWPEGTIAPHLDGYELTPLDVERFRKWCVEETGSYCWRWTSSVTNRGYGQFTLNGKAVGAHRVAYAIANGSIPDGFHVCHGPGCEDRSGAGRLCVNPEHLLAAPHRENMLDKKGGHHRRPLWQMPVTEGERVTTRAFSLNLGCSEEMDAGRVSRPRRSKGAPKAG